MVLGGIGPPGHLVLSVVQEAGWVGVASPPLSIPIKSASGRSAHEGKVLVSCCRAFAESLAQASSSATVAVHVPVGLLHLLVVVSAGAAVQES